MCRPQTPAASSRFTAATRTWPRCLESWRPRTSSLRFERTAPAANTFVFRRTSTTPTLNCNARWNCFDPPGALDTGHPTLFPAYFAGFDFEPMPPMNAEKLAKAKSLGFSDRQIAHLTGTTEDAIRAERKKLGLVPAYRLVDTCAAEFEAYTPYYYSTYDRGDDEVNPSDRKKVMILGG